MSEEIAQNARKALADVNRYMEQAPEHVPGLINRVHDALGYGRKAGYEVLDTTGEKSAEDMQNLLKELERQSHIHQARNIFDTLETSAPEMRSVGSGPAPITRVQFIKNQLEEAGVTAAALDSEGKSSAEKMEEEMARRAQVGSDRYAKLYPNAGQPARGRY